jgi:hypothetical protein
MDHKFQDADVAACTPMWVHVTTDGGDFNVRKSFFSFLSF